jgi:NH3-dependent NAD+ synthetase
MNFYSAFDFCLLSPSVKDLAEKLENMLVKLDHYLLISEDGLNCKIYYREPSPNVFPDVYDTQKVFEMLKTFNKHQNYLWSFLQNCKVLNSSTSAKRKKKSVNVKS